MLVSGGGGEVAVFHINFCLPSRVDKNTRIPAKILKKIYYKYDAKRACVYFEMYHKDESSKLSLQL